MITLERQQIVIRFPDIHPHAEARISFQRTLRIPDDGMDYPLPPGMGNFPLHHIEDYSEKLPSKWAQHGGVFMPMYQSEALWLSFDSGYHNYPIALQIAAGKINAVNGEPWQEDMQFEPQGYVVTNQQPWLDGFCIEKGRIRQFVAAPLGDGVTVEEQITGEAEFGGIQIKAWPLNPNVYEEMLRNRETYPGDDGLDMVMCCLSEDSAPMDMGLGMGGSMKQDIYDDEFRPQDWDTSASSRCYVHLLNSMSYAQVTGHLPPHRPYEAADYAAAGLPWFDYYSDKESIDGSEVFKGLKTWKDFQQENKEKSVIIEPKSVVHLKEKHGLGRPVSEGEFL